MLETLNVETWITPIASCRVGSSTIAAAYNDAGTIEASGITQRVSIEIYDNYEVHRGTVMVWMKYAELTRNVLFAVNDRNYERTSAHSTMLAMTVLDCNLVFTDTRREHIRCLKPATTTEPILWRLYEIPKSRSRSFLSFDTCSDASKVRCNR